MKHSCEGPWLPQLESEVEGDSVSPTRRSWKDFMTYSVIPMNSSFVEDEGVCCATGWSTVSAALWGRYSGERGSPLASYAMMLVNEKVRWHRSS